MITKYAQMDTDIDKNYTVVHFSRKQTWCSLYMYQRRTAVPRYRYLSHVPCEEMPLERGTGLTVSLGAVKLYIIGSCPILVLTTVLGRLRHTDSKNSVKIIRCQLLPEKMRFENA